MYLQPLTPSSFHTSHKQPRSQEQKRGLRFLIFTFLDRTLGFKNLQFLVSPEGYTSHLTNTATTDRLISREMCIRSPGSGFLFTVSISCSGVDVRKRQMGRGGGLGVTTGRPSRNMFQPRFPPPGPCPLSLAVHTISEQELRNYATKHRFIWFHCITAIPSPFCTGNINCELKIRLFGYRL